MAVKLDCAEVVTSWLEKLDSQWIIIQASEGGDRVLTHDELYALAQSCDEAEVDDCSDLPYAQEGYLMPQGLLLWTGDLKRAYRKESGNQVHFVNAYHRTRYLHKQSQHSQTTRQNTLRVVREWLESTKGWCRLRAVGSGSQRVAEDTIHEIANRRDTQFATISTANAENPDLHPQSLMIGWENPNGDSGHHLFIATPPANCDEPQEC